MTPLDQARRSPAGEAAAPARGGGVVPQLEGWPEATWEALAESTRRRVLTATGEHAAWRAVTRSSWRVIRAFTTSFFRASRFLPAAKRRRVDVIYAAVRYPDEVVDSFPLAPGERLDRLDLWGREYDRALAARSLREAVEAGVPWPLAGFSRVVREAAIPAQHYRAFLAAMRLDVHPRPFADLADLVDSYVYGSAVVVGYFLAHVYGTGGPGETARALDASRRLGIALQLTNFCRDVVEDHHRGRLYLPLDELAREGIGELDFYRPEHRRGVVRVLAPAGRGRRRRVRPRARRPRRLRRRRAPRRRRLHRRLPRSLYGELGRFFSSRRLKEALGSYAMYLGGSPFDLPGFFSILPYGELAHGLWLPRGGVYSLVAGMERLARELGVEVAAGRRVEEVMVRAGRTAGVRLAGGAVEEASAVVSNVDVPTTDARLLPAGAAPRRRARAARTAMTPGVLTFYWGVRGGVPGLPHHTIFLPADYRGALPRTGHPGGDPLPRVRLRGLDRRRRPWVGRRRRAAPVGCACCAASCSPSTSSCGSPAWWPTSSSAVRRPMSAGPPRSSCCWRRRWSSPALPVASACA